MRAAVHMTEVSNTCIETNTICKKSIVKLMSQKCTVKFGYITEADVSGYEGGLMEAL